jgi:uncharacterized protein (DUF2336 family)
MSLIEIVGSYFSTPLRPENAKEHRLATEIVRKLLDDATIEVRRRVAEKLAWQPGAPLDLIVQLVHDDAAVARPLLIESAALGDTELLEVVHQRSIRHRLAIAMRREVSGEICRRLLEIGENEVACALLENPGAQIPRDCLETLVESSRTAERFHEPLVRRRDLPPELAARLLGWVCESLRQEIVQEFAIDPALLEPALRSAVQSMIREPVADDAPGSDKRVAGAFQSRRVGDPGNLLVLLRSGQIGLFEAMFAQMAMLPTPVARRVIYESGGRPLAVACRALGAQKSQFAGIFLMVQQGRRDGDGVDPVDLQRVLTFFDGLETAEAARVLEQLRNPQVKLGAAAPRAARAAWRS